MYTSPEFTELAAAIRSLVNRLADRAGPDELEAMGRAYLTSLRYEYLFWEANYHGYQWQDQR